jgi:hypothetical protein
LQKLYKDLQTSILKGGLLCRAEARVRINRARTSWLRNGLLLFLLTGADGIHLDFEAADTVPIS